MRKRSEEGTRHLALGRKKKGLGIGHWGGRRQALGMRHLALGRIKIETGT